MLSGGSQYLLTHEVVQCSFSILQGLRNDHALACREAVCLDDNGRGKAAKSLHAALKALGYGEPRRGNLMALHELLGEYLASLEPRRSLGRSYNPGSCLLEFVNHTRDQRRLGTHHRQVRLEIKGELEEFFRAGNVDWRTVGLLGDACVARRAQDAFHMLAFTQFPSERVFSSAGPNNQDLHRRALQYRHRAVLVNLELGSARGDCS